MVKSVSGLGGKTPRKTKVFNTIVIKCSKVGFVSVFVCPHIDLGEAVKL